MDDIDPREDAAQAATALRLFAPPEPAQSAAASGAPTLEAVLAAWNDATNRLQRTHETLRAEVRRLNDELEGKNRELARQSRLADLGRAIAHVAHEVRNSLTPLGLYISVLRRRLTDDSASLEILDKMGAAQTELDAKVHDLLHFTSQRELRLRDVSLSSLVEGVHAALASQLAAQNIRTVVDVPQGAHALADADLLHRAVLNLTLNALDAMPDGGELSVTLVQHDGIVELEVADSGPGLSDDARRRAFEPFFTTRTNRTGLGLTIVEHILRRHEGCVIAANCPDGGAAFTLRFPDRAETKPQAKAA
jgi:signal transduction histidine kinase